MPVVPLMRPVGRRWRRPAHAADPNAPPALAERCTQLARSRNPQRRALAAVAGRLVGMRAWERLGFARLGDYARERVGLSASAVRDLARVDVRLRELARVEAALVEGRITWTQARLLARVAVPADEAPWLMRAERLTARQLAREVRAVDRGSLEAGAPETDEDGLEAAEKEAARIDCGPEVHAQWFYTRQLAQRVAGERLPPAAVLEMVTAEVLSAISVTGGSDATSEAGPCGTSGASWIECGPGGAERQTGDVSRLLADGPRAQRGASADVRPRDRGAAADPGPAGRDASRTHQRPAAKRQAGDDVLTRTLAPSAYGPRLRPLLEELAGADAFELDRRLRALVAMEQRLDAGIGALLAQVAAARAYRAAGLPNLEAYARERLGLSPRKARALLRLERAGEACPQLREAYRSGRLSWVQAQTLIPLLVLEDARCWRRAWLDWAGRVSLRRLEDDVDAALVLRETDPAAWSASGGLPSRPCQLAPEASGSKTGQGPASSTAPSGDAALEDRQTGDPRRGSARSSQLFVLAPRDVVRLFRATLCSVRRRLERRTGRSVSAGEAFAAMLAHAITVWGGTARHVRAEHVVFERDGWRCTVPGCSSRRNLHDHHIRFRSAGGSNELANRTTLCAWHHLRGVHAGIVRCTGRAPDRLRFVLGLRSGAPPLLCFAAGDRLPTAVSASA